MNVNFSGNALKEECRAARVWFDATDGRLFAELNGGLVNAIPFKQIPNDDFDSSQPVIAFTVGMKGAVVICHHVDGEETWLPADLWLPGGFTPPKAKRVKKAVEYA